MNQKNKNIFRKGDHVVILKSEHGDPIGTITTVRDILCNLVVLNTKKRNLYGEEVTSFIGHKKNLRLATKAEKAYFKTQKKSTCTIKPKTRRKKK